MKEALRELRRKSGMTQLDVAQVLDVSQTTVAMWETGENKPRTAMLPRIAELYHCTINDLFTDSDQKEA